jgi:tol-pal system protein YbgF
MTRTRLLSITSRNPNRWSDANRPLLGVLTCSVVLAGAFSAASAQASLFEDKELRKAFVEHRDKSQSQLQALEDRLKDLAARMDRLEAVSRGQLVLNQELESQRRELAGLRNELEKSLNELALTQRRVKDVYGDVDQRMRKLEPRQVEIDGKLATVNPDETAAYDQALDVYKAGDLLVAAGQFEQFASRFPASAYSSLVLSYLGDISYARKDFKAAVTAYTRFLDRFPNSSRAADAMLRMGDSHLSLKDNKAARKVFDQLVDRFPDTPAAESAKKRIALLKGA